MILWKKLGGGLALVAAASGWVFGEEPQPSEDRLKTSPVLRHLVPNPVGGAVAGQAGQETVGRMHVTEGFRAEVVAAEPEVRQPVAFAFDARGRIWIAEAHSYPTRREPGKGLDRIVILSDADGDGRFEGRKVFAEGLNLVSGMEVGFGGVWVGAAPELMFIPDADGNDVPDGPAKVLLDGFGFQDTHECLNSFHWGADGWLYGIQGVFNLAHIGKPGAGDGDRQELRAGVWRYHPVRHQFEVFAHGGSNPWGLDQDENGELFMTHCRSYWGRGCTTHVVQGGHFWNQANANYAPFIVADPPTDFPEFRNYLLASARYDHGAGGAGVRGSDAIYGGHSHVGTMIYLGDNWPDEYRGHLFTHNLHGHQINHQVNQPMGSGFDTVHAGKDFLFCTDPKYVAIDLQYGPDGAVYLIDWYDQQHCHNPNDSRWDRGNGRVYRVSHAAGYRPVKVDLAAESDAGLVALFDRKNEWYGRMARRLLQERAAMGRLQAGTVDRLAGMAADGKLSGAQRLRALWALHGVGGLTPVRALAALSDADLQVRGWAVQLAAESGRVEARVLARMREMARTETSPVVRRRMASAAQRLGKEAGLDLLVSLSRQVADVEDRHLPMLVWHGLARWMDDARVRAAALESAWPVMSEWAYWYGAVLDDGGIERTVKSLGVMPAGAMRHRRLAGLWLALRARAGVAPVAGWPAVAESLRGDPDARVRRLADLVASVLGDRSRFGALRAELADGKGPIEGRRHAFEVLSRSVDPESLKVFLGLLDDPALREAVMPVLARFDSVELPEALVSKLAGFPPALQTAAVNTMVRRASFARVLLDAIEAGRVPRSRLGAYQVREMSALRDAGLDARVTKLWGKIGGSASERQAQIEAMEKTFNEAPLWAYDSRAGREHFVKLCASCHVLGADGQRIGPELTGAGRNGIRYLLENILDPNAVVGADFEVSLLEMKGGDLVSGLVVGESADALTIRTVAEQRVVPKADVQKRSRPGGSLMPEGLLEGLAPRERLELLKYLSGN
jgi:putative membrane-bound dehydrogenase-like protein